MKMACIYILVELLQLPPIKHGVISDPAVDTLDYGVCHLDPYPSL